MKKINLLDGEPELGADPMVMQRHLSNERETFDDLNAATYAAAVLSSSAAGIQNETGNRTMDEDEEDYGDYVLFHIVVPILFGMISVVGVAGNSLVIYVILTKNRMRTVTNLLLLNLAIADISFVLVIPPCTAYVFAISGWPFGDAECRLMHYLVNVTAYVTVYTLVLISAIRYMTIVHNLRTAPIRTRRNVVIMILAIWAVMLVSSDPDRTRRCVVC